MAAENYCFDYPSEIEYCSGDGETSSNMLINTNMMQLPFLNNSPVSVASFPIDHPPFEQLGDYTMLVPQISEIETGFRDFSVLDSGSECSTGSVPVWPPFNTNNYPLLPLNSGIHEGGQGTAAMDNGNESDQGVKVGKYSTEERKDRILRYLKKRNQRNFNKTIKYACRKTLADKRVRVRGRFAKNNEPSHSHQHQMFAAHHQQNNSFHDDSYQMMKYDEEYWLLQAALMDNFPYLGSC